MVHEWAHCPDKAASYQLPIATAFWVIWILPVEECSSLMQNLMWICCSTHSVILNAVATTQYTCLVNGIYCPYWLVQWIHHCSCICIPIYSPWLPGYINGMQTVLILTVSGLFPDRPLIYRHMYVPTCVCVYGEKEGDRERKREGCLNCIIKVVIL